MRILPTPRCSKLDISISLAAPFAHGNLLPKFASQTSFRSSLIEHARSRYSGPSSKKSAMLLRIPSFGKSVTPSEHARAVLPTSLYEWRYVERYMTRGIKETHWKMIGGADDTGRNGVMPNVPVLGEVVFEADAAIGVGRRGEGDGVCEGECCTSI